MLKEPKRIIAEEPINNAKISCVIILLSNRTLSTRKRPVYKAFQKFLIIQTPLRTSLYNLNEKLNSSCVLSQ